ncbi:ISKra4 family transposase [Hymenobacter amundsenii]|uniref:ISKra4 family transposase n=1 Tax=Hymenobacter amundsenii TaxID=2006685 RepID=A0A2D0AFV2_9BACT|nr:ISKra4 family transposase [Hymenobacter amundsenii]OWP63246.1 ISKra4 family transposase [Hymenobacter amundsenii]
MNFKLQLVACLSEGEEPLLEDVFTWSREDLSLASVGLTLAESKELLQRIQQTMIGQQITTHLQAHQPSGLRKKGSYPLQLKTLFGNVTVDSPRYYLPPTEAGPKTFSPLQHLFPQHVTPELLYLETKWASLIPYQKTADLLHDVLPLSAKLTGTTIQQHLHAVVEAQERQLPQEVAPFHGVCQRDREALPCPPHPLVVGLDGGYVRHWHKKGCFEVIAGKSIPAEGAAKCFGFVQEVDAKPRRRVFEVLRSQGLQANQAVEFFTDGAAVLRSLTSYLSAESTHILDWFHLTMRLTVLRQYALGVVQVDAAGGKALQDRLHSIKWHLWHGNAERAVEKIRDLDDILATHQDDPLVAKKYGKLKPLSRLIADFQTYVEQNSSFIVDYSERHHYGERVSTGFVESAVNQVLAKRMVKRQQMQWTKKGAHLLVQARTKVLNEEWEDCFRQQYPGFRSVPAEPMQMAA